MTYVISYEVEVNNATQLTTLLSEIEEQTGMTPTLVEEKT